MSPRSFCRPTTTDREMENANSDAMPPSSATAGRSFLFTSCPTIPPSCIFRIRGGIVKRTTARDTPKARTTGKMSMGGGSANASAVYIKPARSIVDPHPGGSLLVDSRLVITCESARCGASSAGSDHADRIANAERATVDEEARRAHVDLRPGRQDRGELVAGELRPKRGHT